MILNHFTAPVSATEITQFSRYPAHGPVLALVAVAAVCLTVSPSVAVVKFFDGFGDADLDNNGIAIEPYDVDAGDDSFDDPNHNNTVLSYVPARLDTGMPSDPTNPEITSVLDAADTGLKWFQMRGFTGSNNGRSKPTARIVDDTTGAMLDTMAAGPPGALAKPAINTGNALSVNSRGRGSSIAAFFGENIELGPEVGDALRVSFDFRIWRDAPALNTVIQPEDAELRFGIYQDTDQQLGMSNGLAGRSEDLNGDFFLDPVPAVWGEQEGWFEGSQIGGFGGSVPGDDVGASGDAGWFGAVILEDPNGQFPPITPNGGGWRIREETNTDQQGANDVRILQGTNDVDTVATPSESSPGAGDFGLTNLDVNEVWNISLELVRDTDPVLGAAITAKLSAYDLADPNTVYTLSGTEPTDDPEGNVTNSVDNFDYFAIRNTGLDDFDYLLDNFTVEIEGSNVVVENADFDQDGDIDGTDFLVWQRGNGALGGLNQGDANGDGMVNQDDLAIWNNQFGNSSPASVAAVPEPVSLLLAVLGMSTLISGAGSGRSSRPHDTF